MSRLRCPPHNFPPGSFIEAAAESDRPLSTGSSAARAPYNSSRTLRSSGLVSQAAATALGGFARSATPRYRLPRLGRTAPDRGIPPRRWALAAAPRPYPASFSPHPSTCRVLAILPLGPP